MKQTRLVLWIAVLASSVAFLDGSIVNVALPAIKNEFGGSFVMQQWVVDAYLITLGALMLIAGALSDIFGRQKIMLIGLVGFGVTSILCAIAPNGAFLIASRALEGIAGALLVPTSLALIMEGFPESERPKAIGRWTAWTGIAFLIGPFIGGLLVDTISWRFIFLINVIPIAATIALLHRLKLKEGLERSAKIDTTGALLSAVGLGGTAFALIEQANYGFGNPLIYSTLIVGLLSLFAFIWNEGKVKSPMMPLHLFRARNFSAGNTATLFVYAALSIATFSIVIFIQQVGGYSATEAGLALMPQTIIMLFLASRFGTLSGRFGPRWFMTFGPIVAGIGFFTMVFVGKSVSYFALLPGIVLFGLGLSITVAPLTSAVLQAVEEEHSGIASAVNNAIARIAGLIAIAAIGAVVGKNLELSGFHHTIAITACLMVVGGLISLFGIKNVSSNSTMIRSSADTR